MYKIFTHVDTVYLGLVTGSTQLFTGKLLLNTACLWSESSKYNYCLVVLIFLLNVIL